MSASMEPREACSQLVLELRRVMGGANALVAELAAAGVCGDHGKPYGRGAVSNWITGTTTPPGPVVIQLLRLAALHGVDLERFLAAGVRTRDDDVVQLREDLEQLRCRLSVIEEALLLRP